MIPLFVTGLALAGGLAGLAFLVLWARNRLLGLRLGGVDPRSLEVVARVGLHANQGLALVRVGRRILLVSSGDGGARMLTEVSEEDLSFAGKDVPALVSPDHAPAPVDHQGDRTLVGVDNVAPHSEEEWVAATGLAGLQTPVGRGRWGGAMTFAQSLHRALATLKSAGTLLLLVVGLSLAASPADAWAFQTPSSVGVLPPAGVVPPVGVVPRTGVPGAAAPRPGQALGQGTLGQGTIGPDGQDLGTIFEALPRMSVRLGEEGEGLQINGTVGTVLILGLLSLAPTLLLLTTAFTRILIVLHLLRQALGTQATPPGHLLAGMAILLTGAVMAPTIQEVRVVAVDPWLAGQIDEGVAMSRAATPMRHWMLAHARDNDLRTFLEISRTPQPMTADDIPMPVLMSAYVTSELRTAFEIGFAIFLPFIVIDLVVAAVLTSMGMFMLPPTMIALPCKLMLFVLMDGWTLLMGSLAQSFL